MSSLYKDETHQTLLAISFAVFGYACYALADTIGKYLIQFINVHWILGGAGAIGICITAIWLITAKGMCGFKPEKWRLHIARGLIVAMIGQCVVRSLEHIQLADFYGIIFTAPFTALLLAYLILREPVGWQRLGAVICGFIGVLILAAPKIGDEGINQTGLFYAFAAMLLIASVTIIARKIGPHAYPAVYSFFPFAGLFLTNLPFMISTVADMQFTPLFLALIALNSLFLIGGHIGISLGYGHAPLTAIITPFHYTQIVWGVAFGLILFGDVPHISTALGLVFIVAAGLYTIRREYALKKQRQLQKA